MSLFSFLPFLRDKARKQLDSVFTINKGECEKTYRHEINGLKAVEDERRNCLRQRDDVVTVVGSLSCRLYLALFAILHSLVLFELTDPLPSMT